MKHLRLALPLFLAAVLSFAFPGKAQEPSLRIAFPEYRPFHWTAPNGEIRGFFHDIVTEAVQNRMGVSVQWTSFPWPRCQEMVRTSRADALLTVPTPERATYTHTHGEAFWAKPLALFTYAGRTDMNAIGAIRTIKDIKALGLSVVTYSGNGWNRQIVESLGIPCLTTPSLKSVWLMLAGHRGDLAIEWPVSAWTDILAAGKAHDIVETGRIVSRQPFHLLIRSDHPRQDILERFDDVVRAMRADGSMRRILAEYGIPD